MGLVGSDPALGLFHRAQAEPAGMDQFREMDFRYRDNHVLGRICSLAPYRLEEQKPQMGSPVPEKMVSLASCQWAVIRDFCRHFRFQRDDVAHGYPGLVEKSAKRTTSGTSFPNVGWQQADPTGQLRSRLPKSGSGSYRYQANRMGKLERTPVLSANNGRTND